ncbi:hypothetical protein NQ176_g2662 [Zarea fungicola]|uniref:Uncharacterized protein n=1 Tax=Zarea fungicola TaxID=93591 RepID=A0ACC1NPG9_9HYPO|nr:hypothetical protein NQ176_g2662 [Lecanicillium fungicola]
MDRAESSRNTIAGTQQTTKRFQVLRACQRCKSLRRGCDEHRPCQRCTRAGLQEQCIASSAPQWNAGFLHEPAHVQRRVGQLSQTPMVDACMQLFFQLFYPTIPILTPEFVNRLRVAAASPQNERDLEACSVLVAVCAHVLLHVDLAGNPLPSSPTMLPDETVITGKSLLDAVLEAHRAVHWHSAPSLHRCLIVFFLYTCQVRLAHHSQAFLLIREATSLWSLLDDKRVDCNSSEPLLDRLFWVLLISERSHAIRYDRSITLHITSRSPDIDVHDTSLTGFMCLAGLFRPIGSAFIAIKNGEVDMSAASPRLLDDAERAIHMAIPQRAVLRDVQKANLRITSLWLRVIIWQLRLRLGYLSETSIHHNHTYRYPLEIGKELMLSTRDLPIGSMHVHGIGLTEKLFDIGSAVVDVFARIPPAPSASDPATTQGLPEEGFLYIRHLIAQLPGGSAVYNELLEKHMNQALPDTRLHEFFAPYTPS